MRKENCETADIGWYQANNDKTKVGVVIILNGKRKTVLEFGTSMLTEILPQNGLVSMGSYNELLCSFQSILATNLAETKLHDVVNFCMTYHKKSNSSTFLQNVIEFLCHIEQISSTQMENVLDELEDIASNDPQYIKTVRKQMRRKKCDTAEIGWYQTRFEKNLGIALIMNGFWKLAIEYRPSTRVLSSNIFTIQSANGLVKMGDFNTSCSFQSSNLATLNKQELLEFVEFCMTYDSKCSNRANSPAAFLREVIKFLHNNYVKIASDDMENVLYKVDEISGNEPEFVKKVRAEIGLDKAFKFQIGWYQKKNIVGHIGIVIVVDGEKRLTVDFGTPKAEEKNAAKLRTTSGAVTTNQYRHSAYTYKGTLITSLTKQMLMKFLYYCSTYADENDYDLKKHNCRAFVRNAVAFLHHNVQAISKEAMDNFVNETDSIIGKDRKKINLLNIASKVRSPSSVSH